MLAISSNLIKMIIFIFAIIIIVCFMRELLIFILYKDESLVSKHYINYMAIPENDSGVLLAPRFFHFCSGGYINIHKCRR